MSARAKWALAVLVGFVALAMFATIAVQAIECLASGGAFVSALPWYQCVR